MNHPLAVVIEDDPKLSLIYAQALRHAGFETVVDLDGNRHTGLLGGLVPDLVLLDLHLPYAAGAGLLTGLRAKYPQAVIAVVTADLIKARSLPSGADHVLIKPISVARLLKIADSVKAAA